MVTEGASFDRWLEKAQLQRERLKPYQISVLEAVFRFLEHGGHDYASRRLAEHFLLHAKVGLKVVQVARLVGLDRCTASRHQACSSAQVIETIHNRQAGKFPGKLLPRYAGPVAQFLVEHPQAKRDEILAFLEHRWQIRVGYGALDKFLRKYGLDRRSLEDSGPAASSENVSSSPAEAPDSEVRVLTPLPQPGVVPPPQDSFFAHTQYAGAFLMLPAALSWLRIAEECFDDEEGSLATGLLTSVAMLVVGLERVFHLEETEDLGFALLSGGTCPPSRYTVGAWRRHIPWQAADAFCRRTFPWELIRDQDARLSFDEHTVPRWTKRFSIRKGFVTTRNKHMRCEKLFCGYDLLARRYVMLRATPGDVELRDLAAPLTQRVLEVGQPKSLRVYLDAGAGKSDADVHRLMQMAATTENLEVTLRAVRHPHRMRQWKATPREDFVRYEEPGPYVGAPPKEIYVAETRTVLKGGDESQAVRTILGRDVVRGPKQDRWNPLYTSSDEPAYSEIKDFRQRQHHEQAYRIGVYDQFLDAVPCGYDKQSPDPKRPRFPRGPLQMLGWLVALVLNATMDLADRLPTPFHRAHVRTIRRTFLNRPGDIYLTPEAVIVWLDEFHQQEALQPVLDRFNAEQHRIPWLNNRLLVLSLPTSNARAGP